jgi:hypothetical protein
MSFGIGGELLEREEDPKSTALAGDSHFAWRSRKFRILSQEIVASLINYD